jgi:threonine dehydratase
MVETPRPLPSHPELEPLLALPASELDRWVRAARERIAAVIATPPLAPFASGEARVELRLALECQQVTGAFKARGAWNQISQLDAAGRAAGVVAVSSGNHGGAVAWAAERAGVRAAIVMPQNSYSSKIAAVRRHGAEVVLAPDRVTANRLYAERVAAGAVGVHPYDARRTLEGQGTVALELLERWPEFDVLVVPVGGGGLLAGCALALAGEGARSGRRRRLVGVEPSGAATMTAALAAGAPVELPITSAVQGLTPPSAGALPLAIAARFVDRVVTLDDTAILAGQARLVREGDLTVEPAGAAAAAWVLSGGLPEDWLAGCTAGQQPLRVIAVVTGGNPEPAQIAAVRAG